METRPISLSKLKSSPQALAVMEDLSASMTQLQMRNESLQAENKCLKD